MKKFNKEARFVQNAENQKCDAHIFSCYFIKE